MRRRPPEYPPAPGELAEVGGEVLHALVGRAEEGPTVVFESALSCPCTEWGWVLRALDGHTPFVAYDRPGNGWSTRHGTHTDAADHGALLLDLVRTLALPGPYLLVGHSVGGLLVRAFADRNPRHTAGLVLVDSSHPDQMERSSLQREGAALVRQGITTMSLRTRFGLLDGHDDSAFGALTGLPAGLAEPSVRVMRRPEPWRAARGEFALWNTRWAAAARRSTPARDLPLGVVTAGRQSATDVAHSRMQAELAELSDVRRHDVVPSAEHDSLVMDERFAPRVAEVVRWAIETHRRQEGA
nr:alpha/beta hydrolase [Saccharomonospora halophila]